MNTAHKAYGAMLMLMQKLQMNW